jgi:hypothetical protein
MDKLKAAWSLVGKAARERRKAGAVPAFLGVKGMLALMYDRIVSYNEGAEDDAYVLDLAINSLFAVAATLPELHDDDFIEESIKVSGVEDDTVAEELSDSAEESSEDGEIDPRWTATQPGEPLR